MKATHPPTGLSIVQELERELEERLYPLYYRTLAPAEYHVYLHPADYPLIEPIVPLIVGDAQRHLNERVDQLNSRSRWKLLGGKAPPIEIPPGGWVIVIQPSANDEVGPGEIGIVSRLALPSASRYESGAPTVRVGRTVVTATVRRSTTEQDVAGTITTSVEKSAVAALAPAIANASTARITDILPPLSSRGLATLTYLDDDGPHFFTMRKDVITIGRGGDAHWVDVQIVASARVSREHCRIRRDGTGAFFIQDLSTWGTTLDGRRLGDTPGLEHPLAAPARIALAETVVIDFQTQAEPC